MHARIPILAVLAAAVLLAAPSAQAACGDAERYPPLTVRRSPPPLAIGDSVMLGAVEPLQRAGFEIDVRGCRSMAEGLELLSARAGSLPGVVVVALGNNFPVELDEIARAREILGPRRVLGLVTPRKSEPSRAAMLAAARRWPARVKALDWAALSAHGRWTWDGLHLTPAGADAFADLVGRASAWPPPRPQRHRTKPPPSRAAPSGGDHRFVLVLVLFGLVAALMGVGTPRRRPRLR